MLIEKSADVQAPASKAFSAWSRFHALPEPAGSAPILESDDRTLHWRANVGGGDSTWEAEVTEFVPNERIAWTTVSGNANAGAVSFEALAEDACRVIVNVDYEPQGILETLGDMLGVFSSQVEDDLERFKQFVESADVTAPIEETAAGSA